MSPRKAVRVFMSALMIAAIVPVATAAPGVAATQDYPLCIADKSQDGPRIDGDLVVWVDTRNLDLGGSWNSDIYLYDFSSGIETQLTTTTAEQSDADISGDWVCYYEYDGAGSIKAMNVVTREVVDVWAGQPGYMQRPKIDGDIIVWEYDATGSDYDIMGYDLDARSAFPIAAGGGDQRFPVIGGGKVVYVQSNTWWMYDLASTTTSELLEMPGNVNVLSSAADDQHMVFVGGEGSSYLYALDLATSEVETLTTSSVPYSGDFSNDVDGDTVVYSAEPGGPDFKSYVYSLSSGTDYPLSDFDSEQFQPHISGTTIVWRDNRNYPGFGDNYTDIYTNRMTTAVAAPVSTISGVPEGWATSYPVNLTIEATPSAGSLIYYRIGDSPLSLYSDGISFDSDGEWTVDWFAHNPGGREDTQTVVVRLDHIAPSTDNNVSKDPYVGEASITLQPDDSTSGVASTHYRLDGGVWRQGTHIACSTIGEHTLEFFSRDVAGNVEEIRSREFGIVGNATPEYTPVEGTDRYRTAIAASVEAFPDGIEAPDYQGYRTVVLATGQNWPDALGAASLAGALGGPILLTKTTSLPSDVATEIRRLDADRVIIVGGLSAVTAAVESAVDAVTGVARVERIAGATRYATARLVAEKAVDAQGPEYDGNAIVTTGQNFPDALAASPIAAFKGWPVYLMGSGTQDNATADRMLADGVERAYLLGGTAALPSSVETTIKQRVGLVDDDLDRIEGSNRYVTAAAVAQMGVEAGGLAWDGVALSTGEEFPDALAGGVMQGRLGSVVLLTPSGYLHSAARAPLVDNADIIDEVRYLGGTSALSQAVRTSVAQIIQ